VEPAPFHSGVATLTYARGVRVVSLLPSTTEILFDIGAGDEVVGVTFECDHPPEARSRRIVSTSALPDGLSPAEIDAAVTRALARGEDLYHLDEGALRGLDADLVVTQDLCAVCAVDVSVVDDALAHLGCTASVLTIDPHTLDEVLDSVSALGSATDRVEAAEELRDRLWTRISAIRTAVEGRPALRTLVLEWTDPPFAPGHWVPEMISVAGGTPSLGTPGRPSERVSWEDVRASRPDVVVCAPCGYDVGGAAALGAEALGQGWLPDGIPVWAVDANASFARPGPRLVDGIEALAAILHPDVRDRPSPTMARRLR
jgi:iron complex transport system substrate-binding protein